MKKRIHCTSAPCESIMREGGSPSQEMELKEMGVDGQVSRETGESVADRIFFMKYPIPFLQHWYTTRLSPTTTGHNDHRFFSCFPLICWCGRRNDRWQNLDTHWLQLPTHVPEEGCCLQLIYCCIRWSHHVMDSYYEMFRGKNHPNKTDFFNRTEDSDTDPWTRLRRRNQSVIYQDYTVSHLLRLVPMYEWSWASECGSEDHTLSWSVWVFHQLDVECQWGLEK